MTAIFVSASCPFFVGSLSSCVAMLFESRNLGESGVQTVPEGLFTDLAKLENL